MSNLPFEKELKEACAKPTLTQRETALIELVGKLQNALVDSNWDKLLAEQEYEGVIESLEEAIEDKEDTINDLNNALSMLED